MQPPGSTFKLVMALIGQQEGVLNPGTYYPCRQGYPPMGGKPKCHPHSSPLNLIPSIQHSCNSYYAFVFRSVIENRKYKSVEEAFENWRNYALSFGIGRKLEADLLNELRGSLPTVKYYNKVFGERRWKASTVISLGIGQAELGVSMLQMANIVCIIANKGYYYIPHVIKQIGPEKKILKKFTEKHYSMVTDTAYYNNVIKGMDEAVRAGTAAASKIPGIEYCAKTGTAENPHGKDHSVFVAFAPKENPKIVIAVLVENAGWGSSWAAPIASLMIEKYLKGKIERPQVETRMLEGDLIHPKKK
jgi:penicillin-binding protein 2